MSGKIIHRKSAIHGDGIFAARDIKKGETVFIFKGKIVHWVVRDKEASLHGPNWVGIRENVWIDPNNSGEYLNHSCDPSCGIKGRIKVVALRNLKKGEEITVDYSITEIDPFWELKCICKSKNCRKIIRSIQSLPKEVYQRYMPYIPTYFQKVYNKYNKLSVPNG